MRKIKASDETLARGFIGKSLYQESLSQGSGGDFSPNVIVCSSIMEALYRIRTKRFRSIRECGMKQQASPSKRARCHLSPQARVLLHSRRCSKVLRTVAEISAYEEGNSSPSKQTPRIRGKRSGSSGGTYRCGHRSRKVAHAGKIGSWEQDLLTSLCGLLKKLSPNCRHSVLAGRLSQRQRLTLEQWMLAQASAATRDTRGTCSSRVCLDSNKMPLRRAYEQPLDLGISLSTDVVGKRLRAWHRNRGLVKHARKDSKDCYYSVVLTVGRLRLQTREDRNRQTVATYHQALIVVQQRMVGVDVDTFELAFRFHINDVLQEFGLEAKTMGLRFSVCLSALWLPRPLLTPPFSAEGQALEAGLRAWRRLGEARGRVPGRGTVLQVLSPEEIACSWARIRAAYLDIMEEAGYCREHVANKLAPLEAAQRARQEVQLRRWNAARMAAEEKMQRRFQHQESSLTRVAALAKRLQHKEKRTLGTIDRLLRRWERCHSQRHRRASVSSARCRRFHFIPHRVAVLSAC